MACTGSYYCLCCIATDDLSPLLGAGANYVAIIKELFMIKVFPIEEDSSDSYICGKCTARLLQAKQFKVQVLESLRTLQVNGLIKTRRVKGGHLLVKTVRCEEVNSENLEYCTEVLDESLLTLNETLDVPEKALECSDNEQKEIILIEDNLRHHEKSNGSCAKVLDKSLLKIHETLVGPVDITEFSDKVHKEVVNFESSITHHKDIKESVQNKHDLQEIRKNTEEDNILLQVEAADRIPRNFENVKESLKFIKDAIQVRRNSLNNEEVQEYQMDNNTELPVIQYIVQGINIEDNHEKSLHEKQCDANDMEVNNYPNDTLLDEEDVIEGIETSGYSKQLIHFVRDGENFSDGSKLIFQGPEDGIVEVMNQELQDFEQSPVNFEEIEIESPEVEDFEILMEISNNNEQAAGSLGNNSKGLYQQSQEFKYSPAMIIDDNFQDHDKVEQIISSKMTEEEDRRLDLLKHNEINILPAQSIIMCNDASLSETAVNNIVKKSEPKPKLMKKMLLIPLKIPIEKEKRIMAARTRQKRPKAAKSKEVALYKINPEFRCEHCSELLPNLRVYHTHMNKHFPNYKCKICGKAYLSEKRLKRHTHSHKKGPFPCPVCNTEFDNYNTMNSHRQRKHRDVLTYKCTECDERFHSYLQRTTHLAESHGHDEKKYKCQHCTREFMISGSLSAHVRRVHQHVKRHTCDRCGAGFFLKQDLQSHMALHTGVREHRCPVCRKCYPRKRTRDAHVRSHEERRHACDECGKRFVQKVTLQCHLKVHEKRRLLSK